MKCEHRSAKSIYYGFNLKNLDSWAWKDVEHCPDCGEFLYVECEEA